MNLSGMLRSAQLLLAGSCALELAEARIEAALLLSRAMGSVSRAWLIAHGHDQPTYEQGRVFDALVQRRIKGEPLAYILGEREFFGLNFKVSPATLIPRADTELLVELALDLIPEQGSCRLLDLGTGSGAIALSIAHARPRAEVMAVDASAEALAVARENALRLRLDNVVLHESDWFAALGDQAFEVIISNPPYIAVDDPHLTQGDLLSEPISALVSGEDGLDDIRRIVSAAPDYLAPGGWLLLEHGYNQAAQVRMLLSRRGFVQVNSSSDLAGIERVSAGVWRG